MQKYTLNNYENLSEIMFNYEKFKNNSKETGSEKYWKFTNITIFDEIIKYLNICDNALIKLINKYNEISLGIFDIELWKENRIEIRNQITR